jgi:hypothetical protein
MTEKCSLRVVVNKMTGPAAEINQAMCSTHSLSITTKDLLVSALAQVKGKVHGTTHSSG